ncbi:MAG: hypothetical protein IJ597_00845 [Synergistaceae bacterium]|nr:hypothetical protein [Synergistaceae bacterium]
MLWFAKKVTIFKKKDRETWQKIKDALKNAGLKGVRASSYSVDSLNPCGCGAKVDPRNFGANGYIDRHVYFIDVNADDEVLAKNILSERGFETENFIEADPMGKLGRM